MAFDTKIFAKAAYSVASFLHIFGFCLLLLTQFKDEEKTQRLYFMALSIAEFTITAFGVIKRLLHNKEQIYPIDMIRIFFGYTLMYEVMTALTIDRFFKIFLNIKYPLYWKYSRTVKLGIAMCLVNISICIGFWVSGIETSTLFAYYFIPFDVIFLSVAMGTYCYIYFMIQKNRKVSSFEVSNTTSRAQSTNSDSKQTSRKFRHNKQFISTFLLVITFSFFTIIPDLIYFYYGLNKYVGFEIWMKQSLTILYSLSYICDFVIYTFSSKPIRKKIKKWLHKQ
eukprot:TCONS_00047961-protein